MRTRKKSTGYVIILVVVLGLAVIGTFVFGRTYSELALKKEPFQRLSYTPSFDPIEDVTLGLSPNSTNVVASKPSTSIRAIEVYPDQTLMLSGGKAVRVHDVKAPATLTGLVKLINDRSWISQKAGTVTMDAAVILEKGSTMHIASPSTSSLVLTVRPGVFLAAKQGTLKLAGVHVRASDPHVPTSGSSPTRDAGRPFILADQGSTMTISNSTFDYLGRDWNSSYGLSWSKNSTGSVTNSVFQHDFIGVYSNDAHNLKVLHDNFYHNSLYGVDPHSGSSNLLIEYNIANFNGRHGIIFSNHVTNGVVKYNTTEGNGLNGIMMDEASTNNVIEDNTVTNNESDGVVLANSSANVVGENVIKGNRVGINVRGNTSQSKIFGNTISANRMAGEGADLSGNDAYGNGGEWSYQRISHIWLGAAALLLSLLVLTLGLKQRARRGNESYA